MTTEQYLKQIDEVIAKGKYKDNWQSLANRKTPEWYYNGKFGIFIHWGIYSVPAFAGEWYSRNMYWSDKPEYAYHIEHFGKQNEFGYKDFIPMFKAEKFDAKQWAKLFKASGAKFVQPVAEHHDGFAMYATDFNKWNSTAMGPCRDVIGEIKAACEEEGMTFCTSSHRAEHFFFMNGGRNFDSDVNDEAYRDFYGPAVSDPTFTSADLDKLSHDVDTTEPTKEWCEDWLVRTCELIDRYQPGIVYFDWWIHNKGFKPYLKKFAAYYYNRAEEWGKEVTIDYKHNAFAPGTATKDVERGSLADIQPMPWQTDTAIGDISWGYIKNNIYKSTYQVVTTLIDVVSKNGMLLLNVGPKSDGTITDEETKVLLETGEWLKVNGEGIYDTTHFNVYGEGDTKIQDGYFNESAIDYGETDFRFTYKDGAVYAFQMGCPKSKSVTIKTLHSGHCGYVVEGVELIGYEGAVESFVTDGEALHITLNREIKTDMPLCYKVTLA